MRYIQQLLVLAAIVLAGCTTQADVLPTWAVSPRSSPAQTITAIVQPTNIALETPEVSTQRPPTSTPIKFPPTQTSSPTPFPTETVVKDFPLSRPILPPARIVIDPSYRFSTTQEGEREPHNGVEFLNSQGTPVHAAADGVVLFAGDDYNGSPYSPPNWFAFYGLFVVMEHDIPGIDQPLYTLYAHLSEITVETGDILKASQPLGLVGFTGAAVGSHLHFEVRYGGTKYADSRNPEAWLAPNPGNGSLIGTIRDANNLPLPVFPLQISSQDNPGYTQFFSMYEEKNMGLQPPFGENFAIGNLPPGFYELSFVAYTLEKHSIEIRPDALTHIEIIIGVSE